FIDMAFSALRRYRSKVSLFKADKSHIHHRLRNLGYSHMESVILIYFIALLYAGGSIILYLSTIPGSVIIVRLLIFTTEIVVERAHVELQSRFDLVCRLLLEKKKIDGK